MRSLSVMPHGVIRRADVVAGRAVPASAVWLARAPAKRQCPGEGEPGRATSAPAPAGPRPGPALAQCPPNGNNGRSRSRRSGAPNNPFRPPLEGGCFDAPTGKAPEGEANATRIGCRVDGQARSTKGHAGTCHHVRRRRYGARQHAPVAAGSGDVPGSCAGCAGRAHRIRQPGRDPHELDRVQVRPRLDGVFCLPDSADVRPISPPRRLHHPQQRQ